MGNQAPDLRILFSEFTPIPDYSYYMEWEFIITILSVLYFLQ